MKDYTGPIGCLSIIVVAGLTIFFQDSDGILSFLGSVIINLIIMWGIILLLRLFYKGISRLITYISAEIANRKYRRSPIGKIELLQEDVKDMLGQLNTKMDIVGKKTVGLNDFIAESKDNLKGNRYTTRDSISFEEKISDMEACVEKLTRYHSKFSDQKLHLQKVMNGLNSKRKLVLLNEEIDMSDLVGEVETLLGEIDISIKYDLN